MKLKALIFILILTLLTLLSTSCDLPSDGGTAPDVGGEVLDGTGNDDGVVSDGGTDEGSIRFNITTTSPIVLTVGDEIQLTLDVNDELRSLAVWISSGDAVTVNDGYVVARSAGIVVVKASMSYNGILYTDSVDIAVVEGYTPPDEIDKVEVALPSDTPEHLLPDSDPYAGMSEYEFYLDYEPAENYLDAYYRSQHGFLSGSLEVPDQMHTVAENQPKFNSKLVKNTAMYYIDDGNTYIVLDSEGNVALKIHKGGAYITLEEVAAYMYAFGGTGGSMPANYISKTSGKPTGSIWGEYLRLNHSYFSGDTDRYPYEPVLPNISGCGGSLQYYEMDIGTNGTVTPDRVSGAYNNGSKITRGAARIVYGRADLNRNGRYDEGELYLFYTYNHYNDFVEYLNYYNGWGEVFGNTTGGGVFDSDTLCNPTPYVPTYSDSMFVLSPNKVTPYFDFKRRAA